MNLSVFKTRCPECHFIHTGKSLNTTIYIIHKHAQAWWLSLQSRLLSSVAEASSTTMFLPRVLLLLSLASQLAAAEAGGGGGGCRSRDYGHGSVVCVDDSQHCNLLGEVPAPTQDLVTVITSTKSGIRWSVTQRQWSDLNHLNNSGGGEPDVPDVVLTVDIDRVFQEIVGFGGAFTDAAALNLHSLPSQLQDCLVRSYFGKEGAEFSMGRLPIGGCDFSTRPYTYDDLPSGDTDEDLQKFALQPEDLYHKIPLIEAATKARNASIKLVASPWSAPSWMKTNGRIDGKGKLKQQYWSSWAQYIVRFLQQYRQRGVEVWAVTPQNEPVDGLIPQFSFNAMGWTGEEQAEWVGGYLGPALQDAGFGSTKIYVLDDIRLVLPEWLHALMSNNASRGFVSGVAVHWYLDFLVPSSVLDETHRQYPDVPILYTEACTGQWPWQPLKVVLGSWQRAQYYLDDVIDTLNHWSVGWIDWNLFLDTKGGPNWANNLVDAPIIVNAGTGEAYKQPMFYALSHVSKLLEEGSLRVAFSAAPSTSSINSVAFLIPSGDLVAVILNKKRSPVTVEIRDRSSSRSTLLQLPASSFTTLYWSPAFSLP